MSLSKVSKAKAKPVQIRLRSTVAGLKTVLDKLGEIKADSAMTWMQILQKHNIPVDPSKHSIKTTRNKAHLGEKVETTALRYKRSLLYVNIIDDEETRGSSSKKAVRAQLPRNQNDGGEPAVLLTNQSIAIAGTSSGVVLEDGEVDMNIEEISALDDENAIVFVPPSNDEALVVVYDVVVEGNSPGVSGLADVQDFFIQPGNSGNSGTPLPAAGPQYTNMKERMLELLERATPEQVERILKEIKDVRKLAHWQMVAPLLANALFDWVDSQQPED